MKRLEMLKTVGIATIAVTTGVGLLSSCESKVSEAAAVIPKKEEEKQQEKTEREKLIVNRQENKFADPKNPTKFELKHTPEITFGEKDKNGFVQIFITVGSEGIIHPTKKEHWIDFMKVFVNNNEIQNIEFANGIIRGYNSCFAPLKNGDKVKAVIGCNIHGIWQSEVNCVIL